MEIIDTVSILYRYCIDKSEDLNYRYKVCIGKFYQYMYRYSIDTVSIKKRPKIIDTKRGQKQGRRGICHTGISSVSIIAIDTRVGRQKFVSIKNYQYKVCIDKNLIDTGARTQTLRPRIGNYQYKLLYRYSIDTGSIMYR